MDDPYLLGLDLGCFTKIISLQLKLKLKSVVKEPTC